MTCALLTVAFNSVFMFLLIDFLFGGWDPQPFFE